MNLIQINNNKNHGLVVSSRVIAKELNKRVDHVKEKIREVLEFGTEYFGVQIQNRGKEAEDYLVTKNGFILLCMNYTGYNDFKRAYIKRFDEMEQILRNKNSSDWLLTRKEGKMIRRKETDVIQELIFYAVEQGSKNANMLYITYSKLVNKLVGIETNSRDKAEYRTLMNIHQLEDLFTSIIKDAMDNKIFYKEIYRICKVRGQELTNLLNYNSGLLRIVS